MTADPLRPVSTARNAASGAAKDATLTRIAQSAPPRLPALSRSEITMRACDHYNARQGLRFGQRGFARPDADAAFLARVTVNWLRHGASDYEAQLARIVGAAGADEARVLIKKRVLDAIAAQYPWLGPECRRQTEQLWQKGSTPPPSVRRREARMRRA